MMLEKMIKHLVIVTLLSAFIVIALIVHSNLWDQKANECDEAYGYKCSYYQVRTFRN